MHPLTLPALLIGAAITAATVLFVWTIAEWIDLGADELDEWDGHVDDALDLTEDSATADFRAWEGEVA